METPTEEEFAAWRDHPVTTFVREAFLKMADTQRQAWLEHTWETGNCDSYTLCDLRTRADAYRAVAECDLSDLIAAHEVENK